MSYDEDEETKDVLSMSDAGDEDLLDLPPEDLDFGIDENDLDRDREL